MNRTMEQVNNRPRLLIEEWLPIAKIGIESLRERTPMTPFPAPNRLHVWWARRPLVACRAAILASLLPADADRGKFLHMLGIHGDPVTAKKRMVEAGKNIDSVTGKRENLGPNPYGYDRAFKYNADEDEQAWFREQSALVGFIDPSVLDPTAGGGSIPFEATRLGVKTFANDLNPVAWLLLKATVEFPAKYGPALFKRYQQLSQRFLELAEPRFVDLFPPEPPGVTVDGYLWSRTITCPYCGGLVPLSPNWRLDSKGTGVRLVPHTDDPEHRHCSFEIVTKAKDQSPGTVKQGDGLCPYLDCGRVIDGDEVKSQAQAGRMGEQLYAVVYKQSVKTGTTKAGKDKLKSVRDFRAPRPEDDVSVHVEAALEAKRLEWEARNVLPEEPIDDLSNYDRGHRLYGIFKWTDFYAPRQLLGHCISVEVFHELADDLATRHAGGLSDVDRAALTYLGIAIDKLLNYNCREVRWIPDREVVAGKFDRHNFSFKWSHAEMAPTITGLGYDWAIEQTGKALEELIELSSSEDDGSLFKTGVGNGSILITHGSGDALGLADASVDCVVIDPPYYDNVMYAELSDFFYVWLKTDRGAPIPRSVLRLSDRQGPRSGSKPVPSSRARSMVREARRTRLSGADGRHLHRVPPGHQTARCDDRHVHP